MNDWSGEAMAETRTLKERRYPPIGDYVVIGNGRTAGLVSRDGSLDWLCLPRFDSPSLFAALLDRDGGGHFRIGPCEPAQVERRYLPDTNIPETTFRTPTGVVRLVDAMAVSGERDSLRELSPEHEIMRVVEGVEGEVELEIDYVPRPDYACHPLPLEKRGVLGLFLQHRGEVTALRSEIPFEVALGGGEARGRYRIRSGERRRTPMVTLLAHVLYGTILGGLYGPVSG